MFADAIRVPRAQITVMAINGYAMDFEDAIRVPRAQITSRTNHRVGSDSSGCNPCTTCADYVDGDAAKNPLAVGCNPCTTCADYDIYLFRIYKISKMQSVYHVRRLRFLT